VLPEEWGEVPTRRPAREQQQGGGDGDEGAKVAVNRGGDDGGVQQLGVRALLPSSGVVLPTAESKDGVACCFFSHPTLTTNDIVIQLLPRMFDH
jgi:hypothetical protein